LNASDVEIRSVARRRVRKSRGEQDRRKSTAIRESNVFFRICLVGREKRRATPFDKLRAGSGGQPGAAVPT